MHFEIKNRPDFASLHVVLDAGTKWSPRRCDDGDVSEVTIETNERWRLWGGQACLGG